MGPVALRDCSGARFSVPGNSRTLIVLCPVVGEDKLDGEKFGRVRTGADSG